MNHSNVVEVRSITSGDGVAGPDDRPRQGSCPPADGRGRDQEDGRRARREHEQEHVRERAREVDGGGARRPGVLELDAGDDAPRRRGGREHQGDEQQPAAEEDGSQKPVLSRADPVADDRDEPQERDPAEWREIQARPRRRTRRSRPANQSRISASVAPTSGCCRSAMSAAVNRTANGKPRDPGRPRAL